MRTRNVLQVMGSLVVVLLLVSCNRGELPGKSKSDSKQAIASSAPLINSSEPISSSAVVEPSEQALPPLTVEQRLEDFDYMWKIMEENYPFFEVNKRLNGEDWLSKKEEYRNKIAAVKTDDEFLKEMSFVLSRLNNGHTHIISKQDYPWFLQVFMGEDYYRPWLNVFQKPNVLARYNQQPWAEQPDTTTTNSDKEGQRTSKATENVNKIIISPDEIAYLGIRSFDGALMEMDSPEIHDFLVKVKEYKTLILDIRGNGGGSDFYWHGIIVPLLINEPVTYNTYNLYRRGGYAETFLMARGLLESLEPINNIKDEQLPNIPPEEITAFKNYIKMVDIVQPIEPVGFKGQIYLLVDKSVFSASEGLAAFAKGTGFATIIGEKTGGDGIGMDPIVAALPNSGYIFRFSQEMGLNSDGSCNEEVKTTPDFEVDPDRSRPLLDQPAIQKVLELAKAQVK